MLREDKEEKTNKNLKSAWQDMQRDKIIENQSKEDTGQILACPRLKGERKKFESYYLGKQKKD